MLTCLCPSAPRTAIELYDRVYHRLRPAGSSATAKFYRDELAKLDRFLDNDLAKLDEDKLLDFRLHRLDDAIARATVNKNMRAIKTVLALASRKKCKVCGRHFSDFAPDIDPLREDERSMGSWTDEQCQMILDVAGSLSGFIVGAEGLSSRMERRVFWPGFLATMLYTGARVSALLCTPYRNLDLHRRALLVPAPRQKQHKDQDFDLKDAAFRFLEPLLGGARTALFPWGSDHGGPPWRRLTMWHRRILREAGLPSKFAEIPRPFHRLRATTATNVYIAGGEEAARVQMGHSNFSVTRRYIDWARVPRVTARTAMPDFELRTPGPRIAQAG